MEPWLSVVQLVGLLHFFIANSLEQFSCCGSDHSLVVHSDYPASHGGNKVGISLVIWVEIRRTRSEE